MLTTIFSNWNFMRWMRLGLGIAIIGQSIAAREFSMIIIGGLFAGMALLNIGCCGAGACAAPLRKTSSPAKETAYEEVV
jgi:hypothetical protein